MADWCMYSEAVDKDGECYSMAPDLVIVNVPDDLLLNRRRVFRFLKRRVSKRDLQFMKRRVVSPEYWSSRKFYSRWGRFMTWIGFYRKFYKDCSTLFSLAGEIPEDLKRGFIAFGGYETYEKGYLIRYFDWTESIQDEDSIMWAFASRHPELTPVSEASLAEEI
jgi:hypothetical protein